MIQLALLCACAPLVPLQHFNGQSWVRGVAKSLVNHKGLPYYSHIPQEIVLSSPEIKHTEGKGQEQYYCLCSYRSPHKLCCGILSPLCEVRCHNGDRNVK